MRPCVTFAALVLASACTGCGPSADPAATSADRIGPHGGPALALPAGSGFAEVVAEFPQGKGKKATRPVIAVYFLKDDLKTPMSPAPTGLSVAVGGPGGEKATVSLSPEAAPKDRTGTGAARFATPPVDADPDAMEGELAATVAGESFRGSFRLGR